MATGDIKYRMKYDYHTHTVYSHGKGSIADNVAAAFERGLEGVAISDHGPGHLFYGIDKRRICDMRAEIGSLRMDFQKMDIFLSVEANINNTESGLDISKEEIADYDFLIAGYHFGVKNGYCLRNFAHHMSKITLPGRKKQMIRNTDMVINAIYKNPIKILTHPGDKGPFDLFEIAKACADRGTLMEISAHHSHLTIEEIKEASKTDALFVVSSDAHTPDKVGTFGQAIKRAESAGLDMGRIVNIEMC